MVGECGLGEAKVVMWVELWSGGLRWDERVGFSYVGAWAIGVAPSESWVGKEATGTKGNSL